MCGTEQSKQAPELDPNFKAQKSEGSPFEQYMRLKTEAQTGGDLAFEKGHQNELQQKATSKFGADKTLTNSGKFYTTKQVDVVNNSIQKTATIIPKETILNTINYEGIDKKISRFGTVVPTQGQDLIEGLRTSSSNQIFSHTEWTKINEGLGKGMYTDKEFPASEKSVKGNNKQPGMPEKLKELNNLTKDLIWKRAAEIDPKIQVIVDGIDPSDVVQGALNNSYFLAAVSALAEYQNRVQRIILQQDQSQNGAYGFAFNHVGNWKAVTIDDFLPIIKNEDNKLKFLGANSLKSEMWVPLLEKAYAKVYGGYDLIGNGGDMRHALTDLTGAPSETFFLKEFEVESQAGGKGYLPYNENQKKITDNKQATTPAPTDPKNKPINNKIDDKDTTNTKTTQPAITTTQIHSNEGKNKLWNLIKNADINKNIICAGTKTSREICDEYQAPFKAWSVKNTDKTLDYFSVDYFGLYSGFSYTLIGIAEYSGEKLVQLRNPKAVAEWKGDWGRTSTKWDSVKPEYRDHLKEDGMFYMPFDQFMNFFNDVTINYYDDSYVHTAFRDRINKDTINVYSVVVNTPGEYFFTVSQRDKRSKGTTTGTNGIFLIKIIIF